MSPFHPVRQGGQLLMGDEQQVAPSPGGCPGPPSGVSLIEVESASYLSA